MPVRFVIVAAALLLPANVLAGDADRAGIAFFEAKIRPVLSTKCYACHSSTLKAPMSGLVLDRKEGVAPRPDRVLVGEFGLA